MFDKMKQLYDLKKQADQLKKELAQITVEGSGGRGAVKVSMSGEMKIVSLTISPDAMDPARKNKLEEAVREAVNQGVDNAQKAAAMKMGDLAKLMGM